MITIPVLYLNLLFIANGFLLLALFFRTKKVHYLIIGLLVLITFGLTFSATKGGHIDIKVTYRK